MARRRTDYLWLILILAALAAVAAVSTQRALRLRYDFKHFYLDAAYVWQHGQLNPLLVSPNADAARQLPFYLPTVSVLLAPLAACGPQAAAVFWAIVQVASLALALRTLYAWSARSPGDDPDIAIVGIAALCALPAIIVAGQFNQLTLPILAILLQAMRALERGAPRSAGALFALAAVLKLLPAAFVLWLLLKRQWRALAAFALAALLLIIVPPLALFGPQSTVHYHRQWWTHNVGGAAAQGMVDDDLDEHFIDRRNQSIATVIARLCWSEHPHRTAWQPLQLSRDACLRAALGVTAALAFLLALATRRPWTTRDITARRAEFAIYCLAMLVLSPLLRQYYLAWALPALVLLVAAARTAAGRERRLAYAALIIWLLGMILWMSQAARLYGANLLTLIALATVLAVLAASRRDRNRPETA